MARFGNKPANSSSFGGSNPLDTGASAASVTVAASSRHAGQSPAKPPFGKGLPQLGHFDKFKADFIHYIHFPYDSQKRFPANVTAISHLFS
jgi:hypothetical protein